MKVGVERLLVSDVATHSRDTALNGAGIDVTTHRGDVAHDVATNGRVTAHSLHTLGVAIDFQRAVVQGNVTHFALDDDAHVGTFVGCQVGDFFAVDRDLAIDNAYTALGRKVADDLAIDDDGGHEIYS